MTKLEESLLNRERMLRALRAEIVGPDPAGDAVNLVDGQPLTWDEFRRPRRQANGEEIVWQDPPTKRYGSGILYPQGSDEGLVAEREAGAEAEATDVEAILDPGETSAKPQEADSAADSGLGAEEADDDGVTLANAFRPSAIGLSFLADLSQEEASLQVELVSVGRVARDKVIEVPCGTYCPVTLAIGGAIGKQAIRRKIWMRQPARRSDGSLPSVTVPFSRIMQTGDEPISGQVEVPGLDLEVLIVARSWPGAASTRHRLITVSLVNRRHVGQGDLDIDCLFQAGLRVTARGSGEWIDPYPEYLIGEFVDADPLADENVNRLIYRRNKVFAIGHGCGADWTHGRSSHVASVWTDVLPVFETPATSADLLVKSPTGQTESLRVSMRELAGLIEGRDGLEQVDRLVHEYRKWIAALDQTALSIPEKQRPTATELLALCLKCADRMDEGLRLLRQTSAEGQAVREAFRLANHAMLMSQLRTAIPTRTWSNEAGGNASWSPPVPTIDLLHDDGKRGYWRPFQIAFLVMSLSGVVDPDHADRKNVDLIWFPTGGGKTEAYLGLTAFTVFFNALTKKGGTGVDVLMRYTLRLLTAQQFQRAAALFCSMEMLRRSASNKLGDKPFRIGLWVGGSTTPNRRADAVAKLSALRRDPSAENPFILLRCPWCGAKFGPVHERSRKTVAHVHGYSVEGVGAQKTVVYRCADPACQFGASLGGAKPPLPIVVVDDDIFAAPPNLLIGTVDKFAMLSWNPEARRIFGIDANGRHAGLPPTLVIQDELHLISGPLGSMVGAYETVIDALCTDVYGGMVGPKIVASTATISRAKEQIKGLYGRSSVTIFPPAGLDAADSFFSREATNDKGDPLPGRLYAGVLAPGHGSLQTSEARVFATLMQSAALLSTDPGAVDPWWTLLVFFNSLRELGGALTLFSADTREYLRVILGRHGIDYKRIRQLSRVEELTSRIRSDQIPSLLEELSRALIKAEGAEGEMVARPIDACLASNIIEVGVDIQRLSLMAIVGQPKTTSQYIQVSSRVGRDAEKPGLVVVIYSQTKPRDRSHYEKFRSYHQKLYAQVEPTSVTPFSAPAVDRALHAIIVAMVRQFGRMTAEAQLPRPFPLGKDQPLTEHIESTIRERVRAIDPEEENSVMVRYNERLQEWRAWDPAEYGGFKQIPANPPLLHPAGSNVLPEWHGHSWATMSSMRNVDATCEAEITSAYRSTAGDSQ
ncbi:MAG: helicase-related protein [Betaproteobacteria bacterium]|nr:helicase-related protein [Betaproteobacteria bacterium]